MIVTELPYMVRKGGDEGVVTRIAELAKEGVLPEISDIVNNQGERTGRCGSRRAAARSRTSC